MNESRSLGNVQAMLREPAMASLRTHTGTCLKQKVMQREPEVTWKGWQGGISEKAKRGVIHLR